MFLESKVSYDYMLSAIIKHVLHQFKQLPCSRRVNAFKNAGPPQSRVSVHAQQVCVLPLLFTHIDLRMNNPTPPSIFNSWDCQCSLIQCTTWPLIWKWLFCGSVECWMYVWTGAWGSKRLAAVCSRPLSFGTWDPAQRDACTDSQAFSPECSFWRLLFTERNLLESPRYSHPFFHLCVIILFMKLFIVLHLFEWILAKEYP